MPDGRRGRFIALASALALVAAGCTGGGRATEPSSTVPAAIRPSPTTATPSGAVCTPAPPRPSPTSSFMPKQGGSNVFGAEGWPGCLNPMVYCSSRDWAWYTVLEHVLPRAMQLDPDGMFVPSPLLAEAPSFENGGLSEEPFTVRFRISGDAVWEDGSPITSSDFRFTWRAIVSTKQAYPPDVEGYDLIDGIDTVDPRTAVIQFSQPYADWPDLFGGERGFVLKAAAFAGLAGRDSPDLSQEMIDSIPFSGGPWILQSWSEDQAVLVKNEQYFGRRPILDQVTFVPRTDQETEILSIAAGEVFAIYPQPSETSLVSRLGAHAGVCALGGPGTALETLWFQLDQRPLTRRLVRKALLYALDRAAVVDALPSLNDPAAAAVNCGIPAVPRLGPWCRDQPFEGITYDPARSRQLLTEAGYDCSASPCTKKGKPLRVSMGTFAIESSRRAAAEQLLVGPALQAGFDIVVKDVYGDSLAGPDNICFLGSRAVSLCTMHPSTDPLHVLPFRSLGDLMSCGDELWTAVHWCNAEATRLTAAMDRLVDPEVRVDTMSLIYRLEANDAIGMPLYALPAVSAWRSDRIEGPIGLWNGAPYGLFFNMDEWYLVQR